MLFRGTVGWRTGSVNPRWRLLVVSLVGMRLGVGRTTSLSIRPRISLSCESTTNDVQELRTPPPGVTSERINCRASPTHTRNKTFLQLQS
uniref:Putative secreted protein n=1 Tax=Ixodes ricinus TaxID=34613 RepID=A0A6B0U0T9_IXORI